MALVGRFNQLLEEQITHYLWKQIVFFAEFDFVLGPLRYKARRYTDETKPF